MEAVNEASLREQLLDRRHRLEGIISEVGKAADLVRLLKEVDSALERMDTRAFGTCEVCKETVDDDFLLTNPLIQYCLCRLTPEQQRALENDLELASRIQWALLPKQDLRAGGWEVHYRYQPAGIVSGDICDVVVPEEEEKPLFFLLGDVSGKGVAASFLMARLNAMFRSLIDTGLPVPQLVERANRLFGEGTTSTHYVTLVCGRADEAGGVEICNAGHCPPLLLTHDQVATVEATGFPVGLFSSGPFSVHRVKLSAGDTLFLYTDGLTEGRDSADSEFGLDRLSELLRRCRGLSPRALAASCLSELASFQDGAARTDDLTIMVLRRTL